MEVVKRIYLLTAQFPTVERYTLTSQLRRSALSIPSNIAEGSSRESDKEYKRYIEIAMGSSFELETQLLVCLELDFARDFLIDEVISLVKIEQKLLNGFLNKLMNDLKLPGA
jgi:four helix bundle protein